MATPYMNLSLPVPTVTLGPAWANELNVAIEFIDSHDHTSGKGRLITAAALDINDDVSIADNNLTNARSYQMSDQPSAIGGASDVRCLYSVGGELYFNDGVGNQIPITAGGALNASTIGGIGGDYSTSPANVYYDSSSKTFFFDQAVNRRAKLDIGDLIIRETIVSANGVTLKSPSALAADYQLTLFGALPASTLPVLLSNTGVFSHQQLTSDHLATDSVITAKIADLNVTTDKLNTGAVTSAKVDATYAATLRKYNTSTLTGSGTFAVPTGVNEIYAIVVAAGGGGGGGQNAGTTTGTDGGAGGNTTFGNIIANGGLGGAGAAGGVPGAGGIANAFYKKRAIAIQAVGGAGAAALADGTAGESSFFAAGGAGGIGSGGGAGGGGGGGGYGVGGAGGTNTAVGDPGTQGGGGGGGSGNGGSPVGGGGGAAGEIVCITIPVTGGQNISYSCGSGGSAGGGGPAGGLGGDGVIVVSYLGPSV